MSGTVFIFCARDYREAIVLNLYWSEVRTRQRFVAELIGCVRGRPRPRGRAPEVGKG